MMTNLSFSTGIWTHAPAEVGDRTTTLTARPVGRSDFWRPYPGGPEKRDGHALLTQLHDGEAMQVMIDHFSFVDEFDQAGLYCRSSTNWAKAGVEVIDGEPALMSVVSAPWSDAALTRYRGTSRYVIRASLRHALMSLRVGVSSAEGIDIAWQTQRFITWPGGEVLCGPYLCSPQGAGELTVTFSGWRKFAADDVLDPRGPA